MYPNPSSNNDILILQSSKNLNEVRINNILGKTIRKFNTNQKVITLQTQTLSKGTYIIQVLNEYGVWEEKLIVQ